jgi:uncharacterized protein (TIGR02265 family)
MVLTQADLARRIAATTSEDTVRGVVFLATVELVRGRLGEAAARACDPDTTRARSPFREYLARDYLRIAFDAARALAPAYGGEDTALQAMGVLTWQAVAKGLAGRTLVSFAGGDPRTLLDQVSAGYRAFVSYGTRSTEWQGPTSATVRFERDFIYPAFHGGVLGAAVETVGARGVTAHARETGWLALEVDVGWS